jgi:hypothetical protein
VRCSLSGLCSGTAQGVLLMLTASELAAALLDADAVVDSSSI